MGSLRILASVLTAGLWLCSAATTAGTLETNRIAGWDTGAYSDDASSHFDTCGILRAYGDGRSLAITIGPWGWAMSLLDARWNLAVGERHPITYAVDAGPPISDEAEAAKPNMLYVTLRPSAELFDQLKGGKVLHVSDATSSRDYPLPGIAEALPEMVSCLRRHAPDAYARNSIFNPFQPLASGGLPTQPGSPMPSGMCETNREVVAGEIITLMMSQSFRVRQCTMLTHSEEYERLSDIVIQRFWTELSQEHEVNQGSFRRNFGDSWADAHRAAVFATLPEIAKLFGEATSTACGDYLALLKQRARADWPDIQAEAAANFAAIRAATPACGP